MSATRALLMLAAFLLLTGAACVLLKLPLLVPILLVGGSGVLFVLAHRADRAERADKEGWDQWMARPSTGLGSPLTPPPATVVPKLFDLSDLEKATRWRRSGTIVVLATFGAVLVTLWGLGFYWVAFRGASPYPLAATLFLVAVLLGPAAACFWTAYTDREGRYPIELSVDGRGLTLKFRRGEPRTWFWNDPKTRFSLIDLTGTDAYPGWLPGGYYLRGLSSVAGHVWLPDDAFGAILTWARVAGADVGEWESTYALASALGRAPPLGWLAYYVNGREGALRLAPRPAAGS